MGQSSDAGLAQRAARRVLCGLSRSRLEYGGRDDRGGREQVLADRQPYLRTDGSVSVVLGEEILIQTFELDCAARADTDPMLNHKVCQVLAIEQDDTLG